ncbi:substrate-binding periplasmic protein [Marimonas arenosa]|uniref:Transporter substrate-binding domain-containing protein n=1 Tax=Marimonas arenosa TaxID=1795305 RepID=A0AAE4B5E3_9RHOB|nr:transporter substrate-binding domain-containing protein [Marimonas arenosa]MDQ2089166.1 transporter substrate-binding domain-containing protein [Marimonas arenosa]
MRLTRRHALSLAGAALALPRGLAARQSATAVRIATEGAFPPYNALDKKGNLVGFEIDLGHAICAAQGLELIWVVTSWADMIPQLLDGDFDVIMAGMGITPARAQRVAFSREYFPGGDQPLGMYVGTHTFQDPAKGLIAVQENTIHEEHLQALGARTLAFATAGKALAAVLDGQANVTFGSPDFLEAQVYRTSRTLTILGTEPLAAGGAAAAFRKEDAALRQDFDAALEQLTEDGTLDRLNQKWFKTSRDI